MKQVVNRKNSIKNKEKSSRKSQKKHPLFGTSKLESDFAEQFLDKLGIEYIWQFPAEDIKRWFDFYLPKQNLIIEIDGGYW